MFFKITISRFICFLNVLFRSSVFSGLLFSLLVRWLDLRIFQGFSLLIGSAIRFTGGGVLKFEA